VDYEGEVGIVISRPAYQVAAADAWSYVAGLTAVNDVTARDVQRAAAKQGDMAGMLVSKAFPGFKPLGPGILTTAHDHADLQLTTSVNGELRQQASTGDLLFDVPTLIEAVSASIELQPGDVICTGSPAGVGFVSGRFLVPGDLITLKGAIDEYATRHRQDGRTGSGGRNGEGHHCPPPRARRGGTRIAPSNALPTAEHQQRRDTRSRPADARAQ
jgi:2-keto-4-pentenoate hydratase/2-oxohepta-3-ene-1,7-dioic acid hydratase in catechol pathway